MRIAPGATPPRQAAAGMSRRNARRILWAAALLLVPVPLLAMADAFVPTARLLELAAVVLITIAVEGTAGVAGQLLALFLVHAAVYAALLWAAAWLVTWILERISPAALGPATGALVLLGLVWTVAVPVYATPFHAFSARSTLLEVYR